ncbi:phosphoenolpyruvate-utilizing enzyme, putative [Syntrophotalea carbinolica DSM 2380]|uniref:Phosphoenolpyruvate synthase n=1 Tax=Syntrophotalea carbinolica (strain DSM 2380 / NBRC 103641 / GraBd1) TaxID=338963 RepID=Q3A061_SYNC1|nr:PEP/pyruvate-binding domain-containing protein [Syntrophotalea carbinolica]ABA90246.1 phosphoenolpyruvate-utilizing enzyme, putative [Syntrophotalea carbinolica DSM 2380]
MNMVVDLTTARDLSRRQIGGKAWALAQWHAQGAQVPGGIVVTTDAYERFLWETRLADRLHMELGRKDFTEMRWEELWDAGLRIRHLFLKTPLPEALETELTRALPETIRTVPVAVRSSAPEEDGGKESFAGLHESYVNVQGLPEIMHAVKRVWASLWSDRALLYRRELRLGVEHSRMAVLIQPLVVGDRSGIAFSRSPGNADEALVEAVWGLNQGLVDGIVEPDRWRLKRADGTILEHVIPHRMHQLVPEGGSLQRQALPHDRASRPPLDGETLRQVWKLAATAEQVFGSPQDVEWTINAGGLWALQARPVTALAGDSDDERGWYLSLRRSVDQLESLRQTLEKNLLPAMARRAEHWQKQLAPEMSSEALGDALRSLHREVLRWRHAYRQLCIPMAHGMRLFGQFFNDTLCPDDPFAFVPLLGDGTLLSTQRNRSLLEIAEQLGQAPELLPLLKKGAELPTDHPLTKAVARFDTRWGRLLWPGASAPQRSDALLRLLVQMVEPSPQAQSFQPMDAETFMRKVPAGQRAFAARLLEVARASYRLRDDDNIYLGGLEACLEQALVKSRQRLATESSPALQQALEAVETATESTAAAEPSGHTTTPWQEITARQLVGQPAGPGLARGRARVVTKPEQLADFQRGEILVCDAVDPVMTVVAPLAAAVVERRGGMLIHGAIIAREYGLPCVTGVPDATQRIRNGDRLTVDGYMGLVIRHGMETLNPVPPAG